MIKFILKEKYTKRDVNGNVYKTVTITNTKNYKSFTVNTPDIGNVVGILTRVFELKYNELYKVSICTGSSRISSLPDNIYLPYCRFDKNWKEQLNKIGVRVPKNATA